ncbi:MAG: hypothetical protein J7497_13900, partial [Chitinophagaceae bacterium]|nr:hypothetical protein [Chitinophagaceae bacterium]
MISSQYDNIPKILARQMAGGAINIEEQEVLNEWLKIQENLEVWEQLNKEDIRAEMLQSMHEIDVHRVKEQIQVLNPPVFDNKESGTRVAHRVHFLKTAWFKY